MQQIVAIGLLASVVAFPAIAEQNPTPGAHDPRLRYVAYDPVNVVRVLAAQLRSTMIQFGDGEVIQQPGISIGDREAWEVGPVGNLLFLRPKVLPGRSTNMQVVTRTASGQQRVYQFDLVAQESGPELVFGINFAYPTDIAEARRKAAGERAVQ